MALTDTACLGAIVADFRQFLEAYDWDGVNLAELYFESGRGFEDPQVYTPMHASARREFRKLYGFDLREILDPSSAHYWKADPAAAEDVTHFRVSMLERVYRLLLPMMQDVARTKPGFETIVTAMDSYGSPELREYFGVDMPSILGLQKQYAFTLQVEDPERLWSTDPLRYVRVGRRYEGLLGDRRNLLLDLNILNFRKPENTSEFPTLIQTGTESFEMVAAAAAGAPRQTIYCEASVNPQDMMFLSYALAGDVRNRPLPDGYAVSSPTSFVMKLARTTDGILLDGASVAPFRDDLYLIPAGDHEIRARGGAAGALSAYGLHAKIMSMTGNILSVEYGVRSIDAVYESATRALMSIDREPEAVRVDGTPFPFSFLKGNDCYSLFLPDRKTPCGDRRGRGIYLGDQPDEFLDDHHHRSLRRGGDADARGHVCGGQGPAAPAGTRDGLNPGIFWRTTGERGNIDARTLCDGRGIVLFGSVADAQFTGYASGSYGYHTDPLYNYATIPDHVTKGTGKWGTFSPRKRMISGWGTSAG